MSFSSDCKGFFIPNEIRYLKDILTTNEILVLAYAYNFNIKNRECFAGSAKIAEEIMASEHRIPKILSKLKKLGFIYTHMKGDKRYIVVDIAYTHMTSEEEMKKQSSLYVPNDEEAGQIDHPLETLEGQIDHAKEEKTEEVKLTRGGQNDQSDMVKLTILDRSKRPPYNIVVKSENTVNSDVVVVTPKENKKPSLSLVYTESIACIVDIWNEQYRESTSTWKRVDKITPEVNNSIIENLEEGYTVEDIAYAIQNYATVLLEEKYYFTYTWSLPLFLTRKEAKAKTALKKWTRFKQDNFVLEQYLDKNYIDLDESLEASSDSRWTKTLIEKYGKVINNPKYVPTPSDMLHFIEATEKRNVFITNYPDRNAGLTNNLLTCLKDTYVEQQNKVLMPYHLSDSKTWQILLPQYFKSIYEYC